MGLWDSLRGELIDIIEWLEPAGSTLVWRFPRHDNEIKYGAKLIVREGQTAVFISEGRLADVFEPGTHTLQTRNLPILSTLLGWKHGFDSPFKSEVYFVSTRKFTDQKWGTRNPVIVRDPEFGPLRVRAYGTYVVRVTEPDQLVLEITGTKARFHLEDLTSQLRNLVVSGFADLVAESKIPILDMAANYDELGNLLAMRIMPDFASFGLELSTLLVENISLPPAVEKALDDRTRMGVLGDLSAYTRLQAADAMSKAAENPSGGAGAGIGLGAGFAMARELAREMGNSGSTAAAAPPPLPAAASWWVAVAGKRTGPFTLEAVKAKIGRDEINPESLVWKSGMASWESAGGVAELASAFREEPPPLPDTPPPLP